MKQYFGYVRVSTQKQGEGVSLEAQKDAITQFASKNDLAICQWFEEKVTAAKKGRPVFNTMIRQLMRGKAHGLIVHKIDRSARNFADWAKIGDLSDAGIDVHFASESLDFRSRGGRLSADIQAVIAADYIRNLREECLKGMRGRLKQGLCPWAAPIGYLDNGKGKPKTPDPDRAPRVKELFELYVSGNHSIRTLRTEMNRRGLRTKGNRLLTKTGVENTLSNPFYCGIIKLRSTGEAFSGVHEPLISASLFQAVQDVKAGKAGKKVTRHNHTYRGLFRCGNCNAVMTPERQKGRVYYRCHTPQCPTTSIREDRIEDRVLRLLTEFRFSDDQHVEMDRYLEEWWDRSHDACATKTAELHLAKLERRLDSLTDALIDGLIDQATFAKKKEALLLEKSRQEDEIGRAAKDISTLDDLKRFLELAKNLALTYVFAEPAEKHQIVRLATSNRLVAQKNLSMEPQNWLLTIRSLSRVPFGGPSRDTSRTRHQMLDQQVEELKRIMESDEVADVRRWLDQTPPDDHLLEAA